MKFFTYDLIATANGWRDVKPHVEKAARLRFQQAARSYHRHLERTRHRLAAPAWRFFRYGADEQGLHDATLLRLALGDDMGGQRIRDRHWYRNVAATTACLEFLNYEGSLARVFECRGVSRVRADLFIDEMPGRNLGDLYAYELRALDRKHLALGCVFASGAEIEVEFRKLVFRTRRHAVRKGGPTRA